MNLSAADIGKFKDLVYSRCHLSFPGGREAQFQRWITQRIADGGHHSIDEYYHVLSTDEREFERLLTLITTRETYFFRMPAQFETIGEVVLPDIVDREGRKALKALSRGETYRMKLRAWSAGCATGQEAYSLAMQVLEGIRYAKAWDIKVLGTDINADALEIAKAGRYDRLRLGKTPAQFIGRYFDPASDEEVAVSDEVKEITEFQGLNLKNLSEIGSFRNSFDIILCRNVMIYFDLPAQQRLVTALAACLKPGGYLFTGEGEVLHLYDHRFEVRERGECIFYRK